MSLITLFSLRPHYSNWHFKFVGKDYHVPLLRIISYVIKAKCQPTSYRTFTSHSGKDTRVTKTPELRGGEIFHSPKKAGIVMIDNSGRP
jgi:hypothetical protein